MTLNCHCCLLTCVCFWLISLQFICIMLFLIKSGNWTWASSLFSLFFLSYVRGHSLIKEKERREIVSGLTRDWVPLISWLRNRLNEYPSSSSSWVQVLASTPWFSIVKPLLQSSKPSLTHQLPWYGSIRNLYHPSRFPYYSDHESHFIVKSFLSSVPFKSGMANCSIWRNWICPLQPRKDYVTPSICPTLLWVWLKGLTDVVVEGDLRNGTPLFFGMCLWNCGIKRVSLSRSWPQAPLKGAVLFIQTHNEKYCNPNSSFSLSIIYSFVVVWK